MCLLWSLASTAWATDPFALLFGDEIIDSGENAKPGADDITLLRFTIRDYLIDESWSAFETAAGLCLPVKAITDALEFPLTYTDEGIEGWVMDSNQPFHLEFSSDDAFISTELGWCAAAKTLQALFPVKLSYRPSTLTLKVEPTVTLPMDARLERLAARQLLGLEDTTRRPDYRTVETPYHWISWPVIDLGLDMRTSRNQSTEAIANLDMAGDFLKMSARQRTVSRMGKGIETTRFTMFRERDLADQLGPLKARRFALGDVAAYAQPLLSLPSSGSGAVISNRPLFQPDQFDTTTLRAPLPAGWEAELYDEEMLLDFVTEPDVDGNYIFENVALRPGYNRLTIKLFGPLGEEEERVVSQFVGSELNPPKTLRYAAGFIEPDVSLFGNILSDENGDDSVLSDTLSRETDAFGFMSLNYGLSTRHSVSLDLRGNTEKSLGSLSLAGSEFGGYGVLRIASNGQGMPAIQGQFQRRLSKSSSISLNAVDYGSLQTDVSGVGLHSIRQQINARLDSQIKLGRTKLPIQTEALWYSRRNNRQTLSASARLSGQLSRLRWSNNLRYFKNSGESERVQGELLGSRRMGGGRVRASLAYAYDKRLKLTTGSLAFQKRFRRSSFFQASASYDMTSHVSAFDTAISHNFESLAISAKSGLNSKGGWNIGVGLSLALYHDKSRNSIAAARPGLSRTGVIAPRLFEDINEDGKFNKGDKALAGAQYITDNSLRSESGNHHGVTRISDLPTGKIVTSELKLSSVENPFLYPKEIGRNMILRPGQVVSYDVPLLAVGEAEGYFFVEKNDLQTAAAGVTIEAVNSTGMIVGTTKTEYDGYFYFEKLPAVDLTLRVQAEAISSINGTHLPVDISLTRDAPTALGLKLLVKHNSGLR